ncbi:Ig-like domain-containing protein, partial [Arenibacter echinorum]
MKITPSNLLQVTLACFVLFLNFSCNKDSDLLAEYVVEENPIGSDPKEVILDLAHAVFTTEEDQPVTFNLLYNTSSERKGRRRYKSSSKPKYGEITIEKDSIAVYTPPSDYNGKDDIEITLEVTNEDETTTEEVVTVDVTVEPVEDVVEDIVEVTSDSPIIIEPLKNDTFKKESEVTITEVSQPSNGTAVINEDNTITYTPNTNNSEEVATEEVVSEEIVSEEVATEEVVTTEADTFTYTTSVTNPDDTVSEETGSVTITNKTPTPTTEEPVEMGVLKAFPGAEGFGKNTTGGRGGKV